MQKSRHHQPAGLTGRAAAAGELGTLLGSERLVTVFGPGCVGKSALAAEVAYRLAGGRWAATGSGDLATLNDPGLLPHRLARALRLDGDPARPQLDALAQAVGTRRVLLVVDTCERLAEPCAEVFARLVRACPGLHLLATSRSAPAPSGGAVFPLRPLPIGAATTLFRTDARRSGAGDVAPGPAREICGLLDGLPLAVRAAAAQLTRRTPADLLSCLSQPEFVLDLPAPLPGLPERQRTLRGSLRWSLQICTPLERLLWARCSVFPAAFTRHDAGEVCGDERLPPEALATAFAGLARQALVLPEAGAEPVPGPAASLFRMLRGTRAYGRQWLVELGEERELLRRCLEWSLRHT
ncbi:ATP-binding protein [Streptomyces sp. NPDC018019]|uniref:ATP-binding protein n=1 Tax=Streptomyces sp. NPDC018019 TaxID=3365030 RepID=UPI00379391AB